jgi:hypothetical protein
MVHKCRSHREYCLYWTVTLSAYCIFATCAGLGACYSTPREAIDSSRSGSLIAPVTQGGGYRITSVQSDIVLGQRWAFIANCDHPEWPVSALQIYGPSSLPGSLRAKQQSREGIFVIPVVHAGDLVRLWKQEDLLRIEVAGVSEESGGLGNTIRVRLLHQNADEQSVHTQFMGIVRGPSDVEMQP